MSLVEKCWMVTSKISVIALLMITGIYFGKFVCPYIKKKKGAVAVSIVYITIMLVLYMIPPQIDNFSAYLIGVISSVSCNVCRGQKKYISENISCNYVLFYPMVTGCHGRQT
jgi:hypothetical protein